MSRLTPRRRQVLLLVANGHTNTAIGLRLGIHRTTVDRHLAEIFRVLGARDRANAVAIGLWMGEITLAGIELRLPDAGTVAPQEPLYGPQGRRKAADGAELVRDSADGSERRTAPRERPAA